MDNYKPSSLTTTRTRNGSPEGLNRRQQRRNPSGKRTYLERECDETRRWVLLGERQWRKREMGDGGKEFRQRGGARREWAGRSGRASRAGKGQRVGTLGSRAAVVSAGSALPRWWWELRPGKRREIHIWRGFPSFPAVGHLCVRHMTSSFADHTVQYEGSTNQKSCSTLYELRTDHAETRHPKPGVKANRKCFTDSSLNHLLLVSTINTTLTLTASTYASICTTKMNLAK